LGAIAAFVGWLLGGLLAPSLQLGIGRTIGVQDPTWTVSTLLICMAAISTVLVAATIVPGVAAARRPVTDVLRDVPGDRVSWINQRLRGLPDRLSLLGAQETASQPTRSALAALAIVVAIVGTLVSVGFIGGIGAVTDEPARAGSPFDVALIPGASDPDQVVAAIEGTPDVTAWYSESPRRSTFEEGAFLSVAMSGDPDAADFRIAEGRPIRARDEAIAGYGFLQRFDVSVGDEITFLAGTTPITVEIVGWYRETEDSGEMLRYSSESLTAAEPGVVPEVYRIVIGEGATPEAVAAALVDRLGPDTRTEVLDTGIDDLAPLLAVLWLIAIVLLLMAAVNLLSTLLTSSREASRRVGVQLAVGFTPRQVLAQGAVSGGLLGIISSLVAVPLGFWVFRALSDLVSTSLGVGPAWLPAPSITSVLVIVVATSIVTAGLGATAVARNAFRPASDLVRGE
jgi:putative ABC transport system permease protein